MDKRAEQMTHSLMKGKCEYCGTVFYVQSNLGVMCCPHCMGDRDNLDWSWGCVSVYFVHDDKDTSPCE